MKGLNVLKWIGWGGFTWGLSLLWPEINLVLSPLVIAGAALSLAVMVLAYLLGYYHSQLDQARNQYRDEGKPKHSSRPSRPVPPLSMA